MRHRPRPHPDGHRGVLGQVERNPKTSGGATAEAAFECDETVTVDADLTLSVRALEDDTWSALVQATFTLAR